MDKSHFLALLRTPMGRTVEIRDEIDSTNLRAKELAKQGAPHGTVVLARRQTAGRGRLGRTFFSPPGGLYLTVLLRPELSAADSLILTSMAAAAGARAIERIAPVKIGVKWVNDLICGGKKLAGILAEAGFEGEKLAYIVLGIGINLSKCEFPEDLRNIATTVANECGQETDPLQLAAEFLNEFGALYEALPDTSFLAECRARSTILGRDITIFRSGESHPARAIDIAPDGGLVIETESGRSTLSTGEVTVRIRP